MTSVHDIGKSLESVHNQSISAAQYVAKGDFLTTETSALFPSVQRETNEHFTTSKNFSFDITTKSIEAHHRRWVQHLCANPNFKVAVVGGGIYGCHFAYVFMKACEEVAASGINITNAKLTIFEKDETLFSQASGKNSFRIHKGFHYPRSGATRRMCYDDHRNFCRLYPSFFRTLKINSESPAFAKIFAVAKGQDTKLDYEAFRNLYAGSIYQEGSSMWDEIECELWSEEISNAPDAASSRKLMEHLGFNVDLIDGAFLVQVEPIMFADVPRKWFSELFIKSKFIEMNLGTRVDRSDVQVSHNGDLLIHGNSFNLALNCTYNQAIPMQPQNHVAFYDICISIIVAEKNDHGGMPALSFGFFDGPFPSLEPYDFANKMNLPEELKNFQDKNLFQIFDVELSSIGQCGTPEEAYKMLANWETKKCEDSKDFQIIVQKIWDKCEKYFP